MERLLKWLEIPIHLILWMGLLAAALMMSHVTADVAGRGFFNRPINGTTEIVAVYYMVAVAYLPWAWVARNDGHIKVELFMNFLPLRVVWWIEIVVKAITALYVGTFAWRSSLRAMQQTELNEMWLAGTRYIPVWPSRWILPLAGALMCLYLVLRIAADLRAGYGAESGKSE
jgi:TRAP-type C4-dicarboxylate transport system permease small subunit